MRFWVGVTSAFGAGALIGVGLGIIINEDRIRKEYEESARSYRRAMELAHDIESGVPAKLEEELETDVELPFEAEDGQVKEDPKEIEELVVHSISIMPEADPANGVHPLHIVKPDEEKQNPYWNAVDAVETPHKLFVDGGINDYGVSYLEEEEYHEDDGRLKNQITIMNDGDDVIFLQDGAQIKDWDDKLGDSILVDFYRLVPPGIPQVLYVRNHRLDEDFEVIRESP